jgi:CelD/BcsL family acetyltransferase involved in cellulose biosynthesis
MEEITRFEALEAIRPEWSALFERCPTATPFQSPEWIISWWRHFGGGGELWAILLRSDGRLVGLAPLFIQQGGERNIRQVQLIGTGITDYLDPIIDPEIVLSGAERIFAHLASHRSKWDLCDFQELRPDSPFLQASVDHGLQLRRGRQGASPVVRLAETVEAFQAALSPHHRRNLRQAKKRLEEAGGIERERADEARWPAFLEALFQLHRARWEERKLPGVLADSGIQRFHREAAAGLQRRGALRLFGLRHKGEIAAVIYAFVWRRRMYAYLGGFQPALARLSPGTLLIEHAMETAICEGVQEFDFLRGTEAYKYLWGSHDRINHRLLLWHSSLPAESLISDSSGMEVGREASAN